MPSPLFSPVATLLLALLHLLALLPDLAGSIEEKLFCSVQGWVSCRSHGSTEGPGCGLLARTPNRLVSCVGHREMHSTLQTDSACQKCPLLIDLTLRSCVKDIVLHIHVQTLPDTSELPTTSEMEIL